MVGSKFIANWFANVRRLSSGRKCETFFILQTPHPCSDRAFSTPSLRPSGGTPRHRVKHAESTCCMRRQTIHKKIEALPFRNLTDESGLLGLAAKLFWIKKDSRTRSPAEPKHRDGVWRAIRMDRSPGLLPQNRRNIAPFRLPLIPTEAQPTSKNYRLTQCHRLIQVP